MSKRGYAPRAVDANQSPIVEALRMVPGVSVQDLHTVGKGCPDILVGFRGQTYGPYEIKGAEGLITPSEEKWWQQWRGGGKVVHSVEGILRDMELTRIQKENLL
jgi:hypothetical protein